MSSVNYIQHQQLFIEQSMNDERLYSNDICLYFILFHFWNKHRFHSPFPVNRKMVMRLSHIGNKDTYMRCIKRLYACGYIVYQKATKQYEESRITIVPLACMEPEKGTHEKPEIGTHMEHEKGSRMEPEIGSHTGPKSGHFNKLNINNNKTERVNRNALPQKKFQYESSKKNELSAAVIPQLEEVLAQFKAAGFPEKEGRKFFFHYKALGWTINGKPIQDWPSAAQKWAENIDSFTSKKYDNGNAKTGRLHVNEDKRYDIPL